MREVQMARLTLEQAERLQANGIISEEGLKEMKDSGLVAVGKRQQRLTCMYTLDGTKVNPSLVFRGLKGKEESEQMTEFRKEFFKLANKYDETLTKTKENKEK
jgi:hypothetical protein